MTVLSLLILKSPPKGLFWAAPPDGDTDFTPEDPLALDYLGQQVGLWLFRDLTTRTNRAQNYAVVLYGLYLADKAVSEYGYRGDDETRVRLFERWEKFWALATLEYRRGNIPLGDADSMRGILGAKRNWTPGNKPLPLDFTLISRQSELGGLGAYLSSLRRYGLVGEGSLRVTDRARAILDSFWSEQGSAKLYEAYALQALDISQTVIGRASGSLTLEGLGRRSRLSALVESGRTQQQDRLWDALFEQARDGTTLPLAQQLIKASGHGVIDTETLIEGMLAERWGPLAAGVSAKLQAARAFGRLAKEVLGRFNRAYGYVHDHGWTADAADVALEAFPSGETGRLHSLCADMLSVADVARFRKLQFHGPDFVTLIGKLASASDPSSALDHLLTYHRVVQRTRRGGGAWLRDQQGKLLLQIADYGGYRYGTVFPDLKFGVVRRLLSDLGRIA
ncbi:hypothetical protein HAP47_0005190 [Bradyrhizobium sp. 41S5]|uniref:hypothetical protein n=1 Tax=Bradyrhizobium sp. 41S5 TaxID=1404443 RepID=UPI00156BD4FA|nr:hypothetical protein [Bradyrhizobium sp. 41S5]UFX46112.1 hypothetical protein HAP47_0005190 [Bradyrhizobium sp. 41S5]